MNNRLRMYGAPEGKPHNLLASAVEENTDSHTSHNKNNTGISKG